MINAHARSAASSPAVMWFVIPIMREIMGDPARHLDTGICRCVRLP